MTLSRRKMIALIGGGTILAAGGFLSTRTANAALKPWEVAGSYPDIRQRALSFALLAPNPHNRQPWIAELTGENGLLLYRDKSLNLPATDPYERQLTIGMGCFIELLSQAAAEEGVATLISLFPQGDDGPVAQIEFAGTTSADPLFAQVLNRRTNREAYDLERRVNSDQIDRLGTVRSTGKIGAAINGAEVQALRDLTLAAMILEANTDATHRESADLMRFGKREIEANPDGISLGGALLDTLNLLGVMNREQVLDHSSTAFTGMIDRFEKTIAATPAFIWLNSNGNSRQDQIAAGRDWVRVQLAASAMGLSMQPMSQSLQEYPEMAAHYKQVHDMLAEPGETVQMLARLGYGPVLKPAPRWPLETRLRNG